MSSALREVDYSGLKTMTTTELEQRIMWYAGIGSRRITRAESEFIILTGFCLALMGYRLTSGGAGGSDLSFEFGARLAHDFVTDKLGVNQGEYDAVMRCYLPWNGFNGRFPGKGYVVGGNQQAQDYTAQFHPNWARLPRSTKGMMGRNANQILLDDLSGRVSFVICTTPDGAYNAETTSFKTGGTGQAIRIADANAVKVFNLKNPEHYERINTWITSICDDMMAKFNFDPRLIVKDALAKYTGFNTVINGDIVKMAQQGEIDVLVQGLSIQNTNGSGLAEQVFKAFPEAKAADRQTKKGDKSKLGTYTFAQIERPGMKPLVVVNAYTQQFWGRDPEVLYVDYESLRKCFIAINNDFKGMQIHIPRIGAGIENGCWVSCSEAIKNECKDMQEPILVDYDKAA